MSAQTQQSDQTFSQISLLQGTCLIGSHVKSLMRDLQLSVENVWPYIET